MPKHITQKQREAAVDTALVRLNRGEVPHCGASNPVEPCLSDSGENLFMCDFRDGGICKSCGADAPGGTGCFSVGLGPTKEGLERAAAAAAGMRAQLNDKKWKGNALPTKEGLERAAAADARMRAELNDKKWKGSPR